MKRGCLVAACAVLIAGCSSAPLMREVREAPTGIAKDEVLAFFLATYGHHTGMGRGLREEEVQGAELERFFDDCLRQEMLARREGLRFVPAHELRAVAFGGEPVAKLHVPSARIFERLAERPPSPRLRYVIVLDGTHWERGAMPEASASGGAGVIGVGWRRVLSLRATVLDLAHRRVAGSVSAYASGERAVGVGFIYIFPFPFYFSNMPEAGEVCRGLGGALSRFIAQ